MDSRKFRNAHAAMEALFSLPDDPEDSDDGAEDDEPDDETCEESLSSQSPSTSGLNRGATQLSPTTQSLSNTNKSQAAKPSPTINLDQLCELCHDESSSDSETECESDNDNDCDWGDTELEINPGVCYNDGDNNIMPTFPFTNRNDHTDYFERFFDNELFEHMVTQTNLYAQQQKLSNWHNVTMNEMKAFVGMLILMGLHNLHDINSYWSTDPAFHLGVIADVMTCKRFKKITQAFHVNDNATMPKRGETGYDKLYKIRPLLDRLNSSFVNECYATKSQSIDEAMIKFKGRSSLKQYMPLKPVKRGFKVWMRCDSNTGYAYQFNVYTGKDDKQAGVGLGSKVVKDLTKCLQNSGTHLAFDNFFSSVDLLEDLYNYDLYATATIRPNRKGLPLIAKSNAKLDKGEFTFRTKSHVGYVQWKDSKPVHVVSSAFPAKEVVEASRRQKDGTLKNIPCPKMIVEYTKRMGGVDRFDQRRGFYSTSRRSRRWWLRIFYFLLDSSIVNAHILLCAVKKVELSKLQFSLRLARGLIGVFTSRKRSAPPAFTKRTSKQKSRSGEKELGVPDELRLANVGRHFPKEEQSYRRCRLCSTKTNNKRSKYTCTSCKVPLCIYPCFQKFHEK